ncbi:hypothetical protein B0T16DRAFT_388804 [Cercophora newfieldiana]|uniref:Uncharacterized protein n=1 Tax=Cercophora newfieldiana TaxID=92897 RepID=A0AA40CTC8_9PEZI|nr:hypothetical protein B0T16DRAFT_388804 [Cercophora newfieldiana]
MTTELPQAFPSNHQPPRQSHERSRRSSLSEDIADVRPPLSDAQPNLRPSGHAAFHKQSTIDCDPSGGSTPVVPKPHGNEPHQQSDKPPQEPPASTDEETRSASGFKSLVSFSKRRAVINIFGCLPLRDRKGNWYRLGSRLVNSKDFAKSNNTNAINGGSDSARKETSSEDISPEPNTEHEMKDWETYSSPGLSEHPDQDVRDDLRYVRAEEVRRQVRGVVSGDPVIPAFTGRYPKNFRNEERLKIKALVLPRYEYPVLGGRLLRRAEGSHDAAMVPGPLRAVFAANDSADTGFRFHFVEVSV